MTVPLPKFQIVSLFKINPDKADLSDVKDTTNPNAILPAIVGRYNKTLEPKDHYQEIAIDPKIWGLAHNRGFEIKWWVSLRVQELSGASKSLTLLAETELKKMNITLGKTSEHHLIFLFREVQKEKVKKSAEKVRQAWDLFALTTDSANHVIRPFVDFAFPLRLARRICEPCILHEDKIPISGDYMSQGGEFKTGHCISYSALESLSQIIKGFQAVVKTTSSLYKAAPCRQFVNEVEGKEVFKPIKLSVGEMYVRFNHAFTLREHAQLCHQISAIIDPATSKDEPDEGFEYFDHIRRIPDEDSQLIEELETAMLRKVFEAFSEKRTATFEFYHHHYEDYRTSTSYRLRVRNKKKAVGEWNARPSAEEILKALRGHFHPKNIYEFISGIRSFVVDFSFPKKKRVSTYPLQEFFKGEVFHCDKQYFYLDGTWCGIEGEYYSYVQNEFLRKMKDALLPLGAPESLPLAWVNCLEWASFDLKELSQVDDDKKWKTIEKDLDNATVIDSKKQKVKVIQKAIKGSRYEVCCRPDLLPQKLQDEMGEKRLALIHKYYARHCNIAVKEEGYNRRYLYDVFNQGKCFSAKEGYLVFDQVYPSDQQHIELFDIAFYNSHGLWLYHVKAGLGQTTRDACSQIRTAAAAIANALKFGGKSDVLAILFDRIMESSPKSDFHIKVKEQLTAYGKSLDEQRTQFLNIFKRNPKQITFVFAFLDDAANERDLRVELERSYPLKENDFNAECTNFRGKKVLTGKQIVNGLVEEGFLDDRFRMRDSVISLNKPEEFNPTFLKNVGKKNRVAIFRVLQRHLSQFDSFIAKKELLDTKCYIEGLGFSFRICQIYRDGKPADTVHFEKPEDCEIPDDHLTNWKNVFHFNDRYLLKLPTAGGGACALHALNGVEERGVMTFCHAHADPHRAAKEDFLEKMQEALDEDNDDIKEYLISLFTNFLVEFWGANSPHEPTLLFDAVELDLESSKESRQEKEEEHRVLFLKRATAFWAYFKAQKSPSQTPYLTILKGYKTQWQTLNVKALMAHIESDLQGVVNGCWDDLYNKMSPVAKKRVDPIQKQIEDLKNALGQWEREFVEANFDEIWKQYQSVLVESSYYLSEQEIGIAAWVYEKKNVWIISRQEGSQDRVLPSQTEPINPEEGEDMCVIYHEGVHYSQCALYPAEVAVKKENAD